MDLLLIAKLAPLLIQQLRDLRHRLGRMSIVGVRMVNRAKPIHHPRILFARVRPLGLSLKLRPSLHRRIPPSRGLCRFFNRRLHAHPRRRDASTPQPHQSHRAPPAAAPTLHPTMDNTAPQETHTVLSVGSQPHRHPMNPPKVSPRIPSFPFGKSLHAPLL